MMQENRYEPSEESSSIYEHVQLVKKRAKLIVIVSVISLACLLLFSQKWYASTRAHYKSSFTINLDPELEKKGGGGQETFYVIKKDSNLKDFIDYIESDNILIPTIEAVNKKQKRSYEELFNASEELKKSIQYLPDKLAITPKDRILNVSVIDSDPETAYLIAQQWFKTIKEEYVKSRKIEIEKSISILETQESEVVADLNDTKAQLNKYVFEKKVLSEAIKEGKVVIDPEVISGQILDLKQKMAAQKGIIDEIGLMKAKGLYSEAYKFMINANVGEINPAYLKEYIDAENAIQRLLLIYTSEHPDVLRARDDLEAVNKRIVVEVDRALERLNWDYEELVKKENKWELLLRGGIIEAIATYREMKEDIADIEKRHGDLETELNGLRMVNKLSEGLEFAVVEYPSKPNRPFDEEKMAKKVINGIVFALMLSAMLGFSCAYLLESIDQSVKGVDDVENLGWIILGFIPKQKKSKIANKEKRETLFLEPSVLIKDAFSFLRANLHFINIGKDKKVVSITSAMPQEGKTFVTLHLAATCALAGEKVLAIETDISNPKFLRYFTELSDKELKGTFVDILEGRAAKPNLTSLDKLWIIPAGAKTGKADTVLFAERVSRYIEEWKKEFDWIFFDVPSLQKEAHSGIIFKSSDGIIPVILSHKPQKKMVMRLKNILDALKIEVFGAVLNGVADLSILGSYYGKNK